MGCLCSPGYECGVCRDNREEREALLANDRQRAIEAVAYKRRIRQLEALNERLLDEVAELKARLGVEDDHD